MDEDQLVRELPAVLQQHWRLEADAIEPLGGGMNSATALVADDGERWVAKWVPGSARPSFAVGLEVATRLTAGGVPAGRPRLTVEGHSVILLGEGCLALLEFVPGRELTDDADDQLGMAGALARAHTLLGTSSRREVFLPSLGDDPRLADVADWIRPAISTVVAEYRALPALTWGLLHGDPAPEAFRTDPTRKEVGMIDWGGAGEGPLLYDVASALMYLGGPIRAEPFVQRYLAEGPVPSAELHDHLEALRRLRAVVQADYFGRRIVSSDLTGIAGPEENLQGLADAHTMLRGLAVV